MCRRPARSPISRKPGTTPTASRSATSAAAADADGRFKPLDRDPVLPELQERLQHGQLLRARKRVMRTARGSALAVAFAFPALLFSVILKRIRLRRAAKMRAERTMKFHRVADCCVALVLAAGRSRLRTAALARVPMPEAKWRDRRISTARRRAQCDARLLHVGRQHGAHAVLLRDRRTAQESPTLHVNPGDTINITLTNMLPADARARPRCGCRTTPTVCGDPDMTPTSVNMHFHGTNTSPQLPQRRGDPHAGQFRRDVQLHAPHPEGRAAGALLVPSACSRNFVDSGAGRRNRRDRGRGHRQYPACGRGLAASAISSCATSSLGDPNSLTPALTVRRSGMFR